MGCQRKEEKTDNQSFQRKYLNFNLTTFIAVTAEPGVSTTPLVINNIKNRLAPYVAQSAADGAMPLAIAAFGKGVKANDLFCPGGFFNFWGKPVKALNAGKPTWYLYKESNILNEEHSKKLWALSQAATELTRVYEH